MKVYSKAAGKVMELSEAQAMPGGTSPLGGYTYTGKEGVDTENIGQFRNWLLREAYQNLDPSKSGTYTAMKSIASPTSYEASKITEAKETKNITEPLKNLSATVSKGIGGYNDYVTFRTQRNLVSQSLAKLIEKNRLSDKDRDFYMTNFPTFIEAMLMPDAARTKINVVEQYLMSRLGENTATDIQQGNQYGGEQYDGGQVWEIIE